MAKYDWKSLEKEYILSDYKSVSEFLKNKNIPNNGSTRNKTKGWKDKKQDKQDKINTRTVQKVIEKQAEKEANDIVRVSDVANKLLSKIMSATDELNMDTDMFGNTYKSAILNRSDLKKLTSALKDLDDILKDKTKSNDIEDLTVLADLLGFGDKERKQ